MKSRLMKLTATAGATALLAGLGGVAATSASAATSPAAVAHSAAVPMSVPISTHAKHRIDTPPPDYCLWLLGLPVLCD